MGKKKSGRPTWFRVYGTYRLAIESIPDAAVGRGLKQALRYFEDGSIEESQDGLSEVVFNLLRQGIDESMTEYAARVADGQRGAEEKERHRQELMQRVAELEKLYDGDGTNEGGLSMGKGGLPCLNVVEYGLEKRKEEKR